MAVVPLFAFRVLKFTLDDVFRLALAVQEPVSWETVLGVFQAGWDVFPTVFSGEVAPGTFAPGVDEEHLVGIDVGDIDDCWEAVHDALEPRKEGFPFALKLFSLGDVLDEGGDANVFPVLVYEDGVVPFAEDFLA